MKTLRELEQDLEQQCFESFIQLTATLSTPKRERKPRWKKRATFHRKTVHCETCERDLTSLEPSQHFTAPLIPLAVGGPLGSDNSVLLCASCKNLRGLCDITDPAFAIRLRAPLPDRLLKKRAELLLHGFNHLTHLWPMCPPEKLSAAMEKRFEHPRFRVFVHLSSVGFFVAFRRQAVEPQAYSGAGAMLRHVYGAEVAERDGVVAFNVRTTHGLDAIWNMIELNGLCVPVELPSHPCDAYSIFPRDWRICWREIYSRLSDNRRRYRTGQARVPWAPKQLVHETLRRHRKSGVALAKANRRDIELAHADELWDCWLRWTNPNDDGYQFRPSLREINYTMQCVTYWRHTEEERPMFRWRFPDFKVPEL